MTGSSSHRLEELEAELGADNPALHEYQSILTAVGHLPPHSTTEPARIAERQREKEVIKRRLAALVRESPPVREFIEQNVVRVQRQARRPPQLRPAGQPARSAGLSAVPSGAWPPTRSTTAASSTSTNWPP